MTAWGPIGREVYERTYSRVKADGTSEVWEETVDRVVGGNMALAPEPSHLPGERDRLRELVLGFKAVPAGRHLWVSGVPDKQYVFNCHRAGWGRGFTAHAAFMFDALMVGGGVGSDYPAPVPPVPRHVDLFVGPGVGGASAFPVEDSREGWVTALAELLRCHFGGGGRAALAVDTSRVRPAGERLERFGGTASGPGPLELLLRQVNTVMNQHAGRGLGPLAQMEVDQHIAACVVAGNVRRSARMSIMHWRDPAVMDFIACKERDGQHWSTNISVAVDDEFWSGVRAGRAPALGVLEAVARGMAANGEPGLYNVSRASVGERGDVSSTNPCGEIALEAWEPCNLGHLNLALLDSSEVFEAARLMARFLVRATLSPDVHPYQRPVLAKNRRIGVGLYGVHEWLLRQGAKYSDVARGGPAVRAAERRLALMRAEVVCAAAELADALGVPRPVKHTTVAPTGTISLLSGHTAGAHPVAAKRFIRRVRYADTDPALESFPAAMVEPDTYSANTSVVSMVCEDPLVAAYGDKVEDSHDLGADEQLAAQDMLQRCWADNAVSYTVALPAGANWRDVIAELKAWGPRLKGMTMFPQLARAQQPIERLDQAEYDRLSAIMRSEVGQAEVECINGACPVK